MASQEREGTAEKPQKQGPRTVTVEQPEAPAVAEAPKEERLRIDVKLLDQTRDVVERRRRVEALMANAEKRKPKVKDAIYRRVIGDYQRQLHALVGEYSPLRDQVLGQLREVRSCELELRRQSEAVSDELEEIRFRCEIGEFEKKELEQFERDKSAAVKGLSERLEVADKTYAAARELLGTEVEPALSEAPAKPAVSRQRTAVMATPAVPQAADSKAPPPAAPVPAAAPPPPPTATAVMPQQRAVAPPELFFCLRRQPPAPELVVALERRKILLGRSATCDVSLSGASVSRRHAVVDFIDGQYWLEDLSSGGGVSVNGERVEKRALVAGDMIEIAGTTFEFEVVAPS